MAGTDKESINPWHKTRIVVNADRSDWGKVWGVVSKDADGCWCYSCSMEKSSQWSYPGQDSFKEG